MFEKGDLVVHAQGSLWPHGKICGVVTEIFGENLNFYKVFWYTTKNYQVIRTENLRLMQDVLDEELKQLEEKNGE